MNSPWTNSFDCYVIYRSRLHINPMLQRSSTFMNRNRCFMLLGHFCDASLNCHGECVIITSSGSLVSASLSSSCLFWSLFRATEEKLCSGNHSESPFGFALLTFGTSTWDRVTKPETRSTLWELLLLVTCTRDTPSSSSWACGTEWSGHAAGYQRLQSSPTSFKPYLGKSAHLPSFFNRVANRIFSHPVGWVFKKVQYRRYMALIEQQTTIVYIKKWWTDVNLSREWSCPPSLLLSKLLLALLTLPGRLCVLSVHVGAGERAPLAIAHGCCSYGGYSRPDRSRCPGSIAPTLRFPLRLIPLALT